MPRVSPGQVVALIDRIAPPARWNDKGLRLNFGFAGQLAALVALIDDIPPELMPAEADKFAELVSSAAAIRTQVETWQSRGDFGHLTYIQALGDLHPVGLIRRALAGLADDLPSADTPILLFVDDPLLQSSLRQDVSWAGSALRNREWKAATVLAGSVIEALLLWELKQFHPQPIPEIQRRPLDRWYLPDYIEAAKQLGCVKPETVTDAEKAQNYRNLIHAGRESRLSETCDLGSAHIAIGALSHVIRDLENRECPRHKRA